MIAVSDERREHFGPDTLTKMFQSRKKSGGARTADNGTCSTTLGTSTTR